MNNGTLIISAFPCCGKSYYTDKYKHEDGVYILDSDSSKFHWDHDVMRPGDKIENPEWPQNYINHIKYMDGKVDIIFVSSHKEIRDLLIENDIKFSLVIPANTYVCKSEWIGRAYLRGSGPAFMDLLRDNWNSWINEIINDKRLINHVDNLILLSAHEFIDDNVIRKIRGLNI